MALPASVTLITQHTLALTETLLWQVRSIGKRDCGNLFKLGDDMIQFGGLHALLAASVSDMLPVNVSILLSDDAKRLARATTAKMSGSGIQAYNEMAAASTKSFEGLMNSPWKVSLGCCTASCASPYLCISEFQRKRWKPIPRHCPVHMCQLFLPSESLLGAGVH